MEDVILKLALIIGGILFTRIMLTKVLTSVQKRQTFSKEYINVLNNPDFKVKRSCE